MRELLCSTEQTRREPLKLPVLFRSFMHVYSKWDLKTYPIAIEKAKLEIRQLEKEIQMKKIAVEMMEENLKTATKQVNAREEIKAQFSP